MRAMVFQRNHLGGEARRYAVFDLHIFGTNAMLGKAKLG